MLDYIFLVILLSFLFFYAMIFLLHSTYFNTPKQKSPKQLMTRLLSSLNILYIFCLGLFLLLALYSWNHSNMSFTAIKEEILSVVSLCLILVIYGLVVLFILNLFFNFTFRDKVIDKAKSLSKTIKRFKIGNNEIEFWEKRQLNSTYNVEVVRRTVEADHLVARFLICNYEEEAFITSILTSFFSQLHLTNDHVISFQVLQASDDIILNEQLSFMVYTQKGDVFYVLLDSNYVVEDEIIIYISLVIQKLINFLLTYNY